MRFRDFLLRLMQTNIRKYILFLLSTVFSMTTFFIFINLWYTDSFQKSTNGQMHTLMVIAAAITTIFSVFIISYVHWHMLRERMKSFAVLLSYGFRLKELKALIVLETAFIYLISLCLACVTGSIFSRLFFMISIKLLSIDKKQISYQLTGESFLMTATVFFVIFTVVLGVALIRISGKDLIELSKANRNMELNKKGSLLYGLLGSILLIGSVVALYLHNRTTTEQLSRWILGSAISCMIGIYLIISHFSRLLYVSLKNNSKRYYHYILEVSEFAMGYRRNRRTLFMLTLLTFGIVLFTSVTYTLRTEANRITEVENPQDLCFQEIEAVNAIEEEKLKQIITDSGIDVREKNRLPFLYLKAPEMIWNNWRFTQYVPVVSETEYNECFLTSYDVKPREARQIIFESEIDQDFRYFGAETRLEIGEEEFLFQSPEPVYAKILNRYTFAQAVILIIDDEDYRQIEQSASPKERGAVYLYTFDAWRESKELCEEIASAVYQGYEDFSVTNPTVYEELIERYGYSHLQVRTKTGFYEIQSIQGSFSLFIMGFVSILFLFCILITYNFKVFMNSEEDRSRLRRLDGIGMLQREKDRLVKIGIRLLIFVPTALGVLLGVAWCYALNFKKILEIDLANEVLLRNAGIIGGLYAAVLFVFYEWMKHAYLNRMKH